MKPAQDTNKNLSLLKQPDNFFDDVVRYPLKQVHPSVDKLEIQILLPEDQKFNNEAPFIFAVSSDNESTASVEPYNITRGKKNLNVPVKFDNGDANLIAAIDFSYCGIEDETLCFFKRVKLLIPVVVEINGEKSLSVEYSVQ
jgi:hypothetical protein